MLILAFPSMGKTPLALKSGRYLDLDFGNFREALNYQKTDEHKLVKPFMNLVRLYESQGFIVLSNDPKLMRFATHVYLPASAGRAANKLNVSKQTAWEWIQDWEREARKFNVPTTILKVGLDHYLPTAKGTRKVGDGK